MLQGDDEGAFVGGADAERVDGQAPGVDAARVLHRVQDARVFRPRARVHQAAEGVDEIRRRDRVAVRPARLGAQVEGVGQGVHADVPARCHAGPQPAFAVEDGQALVKLVEYPSFRDRRHLVGVEGGRLHRLAAAPRDDAGRLSRCADGEADEREKQAEGSGAGGQEDVRPPPLAHAPRSFHRSAAWATMNEQLHFAAQ